MDVNKLVDAITKDLNESGTLTKKTAEDVIKTVENVRLGNPNLTQIHPERLKPLDKILINTLKSELTKVAPEIIDNVMSELVLKAQQHFANYAAIYLAYLLLKRDKLRDEVEDIKTKLKTTVNETMNDTVVIMFSALTLVMIVAMICSYTGFRIQDVQPIKQPKIRKYKFIK